MSFQGCLRSAAALLACLVAPAGWAQTCQPTPKAVIPVVLERVPFAPVSINGDHATMLFDTGAEETMLSASAAKRLGLNTHFTYPRTVQGVGGGVSVGETRLDTIVLGGLAMHGFLMPVAPFSLRGVGGQPIDGLLGADLFSDFDLDIDIPHNRIMLYDPAACPSGLPPWRPPYVTVAAHRSMHRHIFFDVLLNGHKLSAFIDTGAQRSAVDAAAAAQVGVGEAAMRQDPTVTVNGMAASVVNSHFHRFDRIEVGTDVWPAPVAIVTPLHLDDGDVILGTDFLQSHRVWLSYSSHQVLLTRPD